MGKAFQLFGGRVGEFPGVGPPPTCWPSLVSLGTVLVAVSVSFSLQMYDNDHTAQGLVEVLHAILELVGFNHVCCVLWLCNFLKVVPCSLPSCFSTILDLTMYIWRGLTECGPLEKGMANYFSILALRTPWTVWKGKKIGHWKRNSPGW